MSPMAPPKACIGPGPHGPVGGDLVTDGGFLCQNCKAKAAKERSAQAAERQKRYPYAFQKFRKQLIAFGNVLCQFVDSETRMRCREFSKLCHHLIDAHEYPQFLCEQRNVVFVCYGHHPGTSGDPGGIEYIPTQGSLMLGGEQVPQVGPGQIAPPDMKLWTLEGQKKVLLPQS
jgi:hypothetical protein